MKEAGVTFTRNTADRILEKCGLVIRRSSGSSLESKHVEDMYWAEITDSVEASSNVWYHAWKQVRRTVDGWEDVPDDDNPTTPARSGTTDEGYVINPDGSKLPNGTKVKIRYTPYFSGSDELARSYTVIGGAGGSLPEGQYQFMVLQMVTQNAIGYDYVRAHPVTDEEVNFIQNNQAEITTVADAGPQNILLANAFGGF